MNNYEDYEDIKQPPHSIAAEQSVLGGLMIDARLFDDVCEILEPSDFFTPRHRIIYDAMIRVNEDGDGVDIVTVCEAIPNLSEIGGMSYIAEIATQTPSAANTKGYAKAVKVKSQERSIITASYSIGDLGFNPDMTVDEKISSAQQLVMCIGESSAEEQLTNNQVLYRWIDKLEDRFKNGNSFGLSTGLKDLDTRLHGLQSPDLIILAARPAMGKTTLAVQMAAHAAITDGVPTLVFTLEMSRDQLYDKMVSLISSIPFDRIKKGTLLEEDWPKLSSAVTRMKDKPLFIDERSSLHVNQIAATARRINRKSKLGLIVIDYLQLVRGDGDNRTGEVGNITRMLKSLAKDLDCPVLALSQLSRKCEERGDKRPISSDLRDSGEIEQDADILLFMYRDEVYDKASQAKGVTEIITRKFRGGEIGTDFVTSRLEMSRFDNMAHGYVPPVPEVKTGKGFNY